MIICIYLYIKQLRSHREEHEKQFGMEIQNELALITSKLNQTKVEREQFEENVFKTLNDTVEQMKETRQ